MWSTGELLADDLASMLLDILPDTPCFDDTLSCALRTLVDLMIPATLALAACVGLGFLMAVWFSLITARLERSRKPVPRRAKRRLLSGPTHSDGAWVRLVEDEQGRRMIEVLEGATWRPATRDLTRFAVDVPLTPMSHP
jgi:hypothetical protein